MCWCLQISSRMNFPVSSAFSILLVNQPPVAAVAVLDSDGDGVTDEQDQCAQTPPDMKVNRQGCPVDPPDGDRDGVPDYLDRCRNTVRGAVVDRSGCLSDRDNDGVADVFDKCPDNPPGFEVGADGCMKISR